MITNITPIDLKNIGIIKARLDQSIIDAIKAELEKISEDFSKAEPKNKDLAGHIRKEYVLQDCCSAVEEIAVKLAIEHNKHYRYTDNIYSGLPGPRFRFELESLWVNFQERYEFNPLHRHHGIYSFVAWINLPYFLNFENQVSPGSKSYVNRSGCFEFVFTNILGHITSELIPADKHYEGDIVLFPSDLHHMVHPFYSTDKQRISIAGNLIAVAE